MKKKTFILTLFTLVALVTACSNTDSSNMNNPTANNQTTQNNNDSSTNNENKEATDATTGPSWVTDDKSLTYLDWDHLLFFLPLEPSVPFAFYHFPMPCYFRFSCNTRGSSKSFSSSIFLSHKIFCVSPSLTIFPLFNK